ncbi:MAG: aminopeptidase P family protein [Oscillospiraceae bacterium]|jgi:Xaa-Pro aminopeptidase|nr:aminopeptidase P family protein [Oscillospiraceae bacterium]
MNEIARKIMDKLAGIADSAFVTSSSGRIYIFSNSPSEGFVLLTKSEAYVLTDSRYFEEASSLIKDVNVLCFTNLKETIKSLIKKHKLKKIALEKKHVTVQNFYSFRESFRSLGTSVICSSRLDRIISDLRVIKSEKEIKKIKEAQRLAEFAFEKVLTEIRSGVTEREIALKIEFLMRKNGASGIAFDFIIVSGERTSLPHGKCSDKKLKNGDLLIIDIGAVLDGYHSDMTRTLCVKSASEREKNIYDVVLKAQLAGIDAVKHGVLAGDVDKVVRNVIKNYGYDKNFIHNTGHGVGLEIHEAPQISVNCDTMLEAGMVITIEPGIYLPKKFGIRIEDMLLVTKDGCKNFTTIPKETLISC